MSNQTSEYDIKCKKTPLDGNTVLTGLLTYPTDHTVSPQMYGAAYEEMGLNWVYMAFNTPAEKLEDAIKGYRALNVRGGNVALPHKVEVMKYMDEIDPTAAAIGAMNVIVNTDGYLKGYSADYLGFLLGLEKNNVDVSGKKIVMLGAGGAARACAFGLCMSEIKELVILNIDPAQAERLADTLSKRYGRKVRGIALTNENMGKELLDAQILVNCTSVGFADQEGKSLVPPELLRSDMIVYDIIWDPLQTKLQKDAAEKGAKTISGLNMLVGQAAVCIELMTGKEPPFQTMYDTTVQVLKARAHK